MATVRRTANSHTEPFEFERPFSQAYWYSKIWNQDLPKSVNLRLDVLHAMNRTLDPDVIEQSSRAVLEKLCEHKGMRAIVDITHHRVNKRQVKGFVVYTDGLCDQALETLSSSRARQQSDLTVCLQEASLATQNILRDLEAMLQEEDEEDFRHRPTDYAYNLARQIIESAYTTHYVNFAPTPTIAPDGDGGLALEWKVGRRVIRLIVSHNQDMRSYIYKRGEDRPSQIYAASGEILVEQLRSVFAD